MRKALAVLATAIVLGGCYHATVDIGPAPGGVTQQSSGQVISIPWAHSFVYGLIPPATVDAKAKCANGVSKVETQMSFVNGLVSALTFSLYTPMTITVTCR